MKKAVCVILICMLCLTGTFSVYAAGVREPVIEGEMPDCYAIVGEQVLTLYTDASSPDGGMLEYQWYSTTVNDIATIRAIDEETEATFIPPQTVGVMYYCYAVWNIKSGLTSSPVYSRLIRVEYVEGEPTVDSIEIVSTPDKVVYTSGECLDLTGLQVRIWMSDGYIDSVNGDKLEITRNPLVTVGEQKIKVTYQGISDFFIVTVEEAAHTHSFGEWMIVTKPTCTESGIKARECDCGYTERSEVAATGHQWDEGRITKEATKDSDGKRTFTCTVCKATKTEVIKALTPVSTPPESSDALQNDKNESTIEKHKSTGHEASSESDSDASISEGRKATEKEPSPEFPWWMIITLSSILVIGAIVGFIIIWRKKKSSR